MTPSAARGARLARPPDFDFVGFACAGFGARAGFTLRAISDPELLAQLREVLHDEPRSDAVRQPLAAAVDPRRRDPGLLRRLEVVEDRYRDVELAVGARSEALARLVEVRRRRLVGAHVLGRDLLRERDPEALHHGLERCAVD